MLKFIKPDYKVNEYVESNYYGKFVLEPLERGFGTTIGNALRRVMLSSLEGSAITDVKIEGVMHEFQKMDGVVEDVTEIILNLKKLVLKNHSENDQVLHLKANKEGEVHASDIDKNGEVEIINPDLLIATLSKGGSLDMTMTVSNGRGYVDGKINAIAVKDVVGAIGIDEFWDYDVLYNELISANSKYIVAKTKDNIIVAFAGIKIILDTAEIMNIVTKKSMRNLGIGSYMLENLISICKKNNIKKY